MRYIHSMRCFLSSAVISILALLAISPLRGQTIEARFTTDKSDYLIGEPLFVTLVLRNMGEVPQWVDFGPSNLFCSNFAVEIPGANSALEQWGCGTAGSCARGLREVPPGKSISVRQLVNREFRLEQSGVYLIRVRTTLTIRNENLFNSPPTTQFDVSDNLSARVQPGSEDQLKAVFKPFVTNLDSSDLAQRSEAATAILVSAPPSLEDVLIKIANTPSAFAAMDALRKANTPKTRDTLAQNAAGNSTLVVRLEAIRNLGRTGDTKYLPMLLEMMKSDNAQIKGAAAQAVGTLGGEAAVQDVAALVRNVDVETRQTGANALEYTHARTAVPTLIGLLLDPNPSIRQTAVAGLAVLTHRAVLDGNRWADISMPQDPISVHQKWTLWWNSHADSAEIHGMNDCVAPIALN